MAITSHVAAPDRRDAAPASSLAHRVLWTGPVVAVVALVLAVATGATAQSGSVPAWVPWAALLCLAAGVPHGAVDQLAISTSRRASWVVGYVAVAAAATALILLRPGPAFVVVVAMSVWHFGSGDVESHSDLGGTTGERRVWSTLHALSLGATAVVLPLTAPATAATLRMIQPDLSLPDGDAATIARLCTLLLVSVVIGRLVLTHRIRAALELVVLAALGLLVTPLLAFGVYFATWHALRHTARLAQSPTGTVDSRSLVAVVVDGVPALVVSVAVVIATALAHGAVSPGPLLWTGLALVWGLTVPHMAVVAQFDSDRRRRRTSAAP